MTMVTLIYVYIASDILCDVFDVFQDESLNCVVVIDRSKTKNLGSKYKNQEEGKQSTHLYYIIHSSSPKAIATISSYC
jgi:hypothetical protein